MKTKLKVTSYELHVFGIVAIGICFVIVSCVLGFLASDSASTGINLPVIKPLPADWNPYQRLYDELLAPTVRISSPSGIGSGVIIQGYKLQDTSCKLDNLKPVTSNTVTYVLTAAHVVENYSDVSVTFYSYSHQDTKTPSNSLCLSAFVVMTDTNKDLALIRIPPTPLTKGGTKGGISSAKLASKNYNYYLFTPVYAVGCSLGLDPRPSSGIISAIHLSDLCVSAVEISAPILPGNSGGPVFDRNTHEVIGIAVWVKTYQGQLITTMAGIVPINQIYEFLDKVQLMNSEEDKSDDINKEH